MSGICGVVRPGAPGSAHGDVEALTTFLEFRGPDGRMVWSGHEAGLGNTLLRTHDGPEEGLLGSRGVWITADARIDAHDALRSELRAAGNEPPREASDTALILAAYASWGENCAKHLLGDFAFAIWDGPRRRLYCARDHFGVKPFFYATPGTDLIFSNTLAALVNHPAVGAQLNELAVADFLLFEMNQDPASTAYEKVKRLPPAHALVLTPRGVRTTRYWSPPEDIAVRHRGSRECVEEFRTLLAEGVADRVRSRAVVVHMSGGLDSTAVAASARDHLARKNVRFELRAHTAVYDRLFRDDERQFTRIAAEGLRIPVDFHPSDDYALFERRDELAHYFPEPANKPLAALEVDLARRAARSARVALTGWDGDTLMSESPRAYFGTLLRERQFVRLAASGIHYAFAERKVLPAGALRKLNPWNRRVPPPSPECPRWVNPDFARRLGLAERMRDMAPMRPSNHPVRPYALRILDYVMRLSSFFEFYDPGRTGELVEFRHPMLDLRLIEFCLSLPPYPWCMRKKVLRDALRGIVPEAVRTRPKTPLAGFPYFEALKRDDARWVDAFEPCARTADFVDRAKIPPSRGDPDPDRVWTNLRPLGLDLWLRQLEGAATLKGSVQ